MERACCDAGILVYTDGCYGAPAATNGAVWGIYASGGQCEGGPAGKPAVFTRLSSYISWIQANAGGMVTFVRS